MFSTCPVCNNSFLSTPERNKYCSTTCRARGVGLAKSQKLHLNCLVCDKPLEVKPCHYKRGNGKYCSAECQHIAQRTISPTQLHSLYWEQRLSASQIAQRYGITRRAIQKKMAQYGIITRTLAEGRRLHPGRHKGIKQNLSREQRRAKSQRMKELWEYKNRVVRAVMRGAHIRPSSAESKVNKILETYFSNNWKYVGDGQFIIGGLCPDFININGRKLAIDVFGDYWHGKGANRSASYEPYRQKVLSKYGFQLLVIWERELQDKAKVVEKVQKFMEVSL